ncbi:phage head spike fiber domain-containing protein [Cupriavidus gilardii]|uniref:phage head spike fiber domain-containing protein n=1 Tax=Cupriavidus gilardii TaxID=82541 RepID=UPI0021B1BC48|nr:hypothetical protein [Cupriavidus gilardii]UXC38294.1 hypothetical protein N4G38_24855 [Cupriavidus gilardii]
MLVPKSFTDLITFSRSSAGWHYNSAGVLVQAGANIPRFDYDPVTRQPRGLLVEEGRTNLFRYSQQFDNTSWGISRGSISANSAAAPDGTTSADKLIDGTTSGATYVYQAVSLTHVAHAVSIYAKAAELTRFRIRDFTDNHVSQEFDLISGVVSGVATGGMTGARMEALPNGWWRCSTIWTPATAGNHNLSPVELVADPADGTSGLYVWGAQLEVGAFVTSPIATVGAQVARSADIVQVQNMGPWFSGAEGTLVCAATTMGPSSDCTIVAANNGTQNEQFDVRFGVTNILSRIRHSGVNEAQLVAIPGAPSAGQIYTIATAYRENDAAVAANGRPPATDSQVALPTGVSRFEIGSRTGTQFLNGHIRYLRYYPYRLSNAELQALTA